MSVFGGDDAEDAQRQQAQAQAEADREYAAANATAHEKMWSTYRGWVEEAGRDYVTDLASAEASMAAGGLRSGTSSWERRLRSVDQSYAQNIEDLRAGETYGALSSYYVEQEATGGVDAYYSGLWDPIAQAPSAFTERQQEIGAGNNNIAISDYIPEASLADQIDQSFGESGVLYDFDWTGISY